MFSFLSFGIQFVWLSKKTNYNLNINYALNILEARRKPVLLRGQPILANMIRQINGLTILYLSETKRLSCAYMIQIRNFPKATITNLFSGMVV